MDDNNDNEVNINQKHSMDPSEHPDMDIRGKVRLTIVKSTPHIL